MEVKKIFKTLLFIFIIIIITFQSCVAKKNIRLFSNCFKIDFSDPNIDLDINEKVKEDILKLKSDFKEYRVTYIAYNKIENLYYVELLKEYTFYCLTVDKNYKIIVEEKNYLDI